MYTRQQIIQRYENIVQRWQNDGELIRLFPDRYKEIKGKLQALKDGAEYTIKDVTKEMIMDMGAKICGLQQMNPLDEDKGLVSDHRKNNWEYKTDIPDFVDKIVERKMSVGK